MHYVWGGLNCRFPSPFLSGWEAVGISEYSFTQGDFSRGLLLLISLT